MNESSNRSNLADQQRTLTVEDRIIRHNVTLTYCAFVLIARKKIESLRTEFKVTNQEVINNSLLPCTYFRILLLRLILSTAHNYCDDERAIK